MVTLRNDLSTTAGHQHTSSTTCRSKYSKPRDYTSQRRWPVYSPTGRQPTTIRTTNTLFHQAIPSTAISPFNPIQLVKPASETNIQTPLSLYMKRFILNRDHDTIHFDNIIPILRLTRPQQINSNTNYVALWDVGTLFQRVFQPQIRLLMCFSLSQTFTTTVSSSLACISSKRFTSSKLSSW